MQTIRLTVRADADGVLRFEVPLPVKDQDVEVVLVMNPLPPEPVDAMGYPIGYFEETYGSLADDPLVRDQPRQPDVRDEIE